MERDQHLEKKPRRKYTDRFKAELVAEYLESSNLLTSLAVKNGMNPNVLHRWVNEHERFGKHDLSELADENRVASNINTASGANNWFAIVPRQENKPITARRSVTSDKSGYTSNKKSGDINLELNSGKLSLKLTWPGSDQSGLIKFIKELMA